MQKLQMNPMKVSTYAILLNKQWINEIQIINKRWVNINKRWLSPQTRVE